MRERHLRITVLGSHAIRLPYLGPARPQGCGCPEVRKVWATDGRPAPAFLKQFLDRTGDPVGGDFPSNHPRERVENIVPEAWLVPRQDLATNVRFEFDPWTG